MIAGKTSLVPAGNVPRRTSIVLLSAGEVPSNAQMRCSEQLSFPGIVDPEIAKIICPPAIGSGTVIPNKRRST